MRPYPKKKKAKKRKHHAASLLQRQEDRHRCFLCMHLHDDFTEKAVEKHHIFGGSRRDASEAAGLYVYLCHAHHTEGPEAVHRNEAVSRILKEKAQAAYEREHSKEDFISRFHKNYL